MNVQDQTIPLYGRIVEKYNNLPATQARQSAFHKFQLLGFPTIRNEDWKYTNITRFLKDQYAIDAKPVAPPAHLLAKAPIPDLEASHLVLVNGSWNGEITGGPLPKGSESTRVKNP